MRDTIEYRSAAVEIRGEADAPRLYVRAIAAGEQAGDRLEVFDQLPTQPEGGVLVGRLHPANKAPVLRAQLEERDGALILDVDRCQPRSGARTRDRSPQQNPADGLDRVSRAGRSRGRRCAPDLPVGYLRRGARPVRGLCRIDRRSPTPAPAPRAVVADGRRYRHPSNRGG